MKRVLVSIKRIVIAAAMIFIAMCAVSGCKGSKKVPTEQKPSTLDTDQQKFRQDVFEKETK